MEGSQPTQGLSASVSPAPAYPAEAYAVDFATLAREIAQDILEISDILRIHRLSDEEWLRIQCHPRFIAILGDMTRQWNSASNTAERIKIKAQTGLETQLETFIADMGDPRIPLTQRTDAARLLARLGELDGHIGGIDAGGKFSITLNIGSTAVATDVTSTPPKVIDHAG